MNNISVLDCTLRDGGYINNWNFGEKVIEGVINNLVDAKIDIIECGFIRNVEHTSESSVYNSMDQIVKVISPKAKNTLYAVMIEHHNNVYDLITEYNENAVDIIRVTFRRKEWNEAKIKIEQLIGKPLRRK